MFGAIRHVVRQTHALVREHIVKRVTRSDKWPALRRHFIQSNPTCAACAGTTLLQVHHVKPFHLDPQLELDAGNLITLCMGKFECHLLLGHGGKFSAFNPAVRGDASLVLQNPMQRPLVEQKAKNGRLEADPIK